MSIVFPFFEGPDRNAAGAFSFRVRKIIVSVPVFL